MPIIEGSVPRGAGVELGAGGSYYVDTVSGSNSNGGRSWSNALASVATALGLMSAGDRVYVFGDVREQTATTANYITITGVARTPSQRVRWRAPASATATTPLLDIKHRGVVVEGFTFNAPTDAAAIRVFRDGTYNSGDSEIIGCDFNTGAIGIESNGGSANVKVRRNQFRSMTSGSVTTSGGIISTSTAQALPLQWRIEENVFLNSANHIVLPGNSCVVDSNVFQDIGHDISATVCFDFTGGARNLFACNKTTGAWSATLYKAGTNPAFSGNFINETAGVSGEAP